MIINSNTGKYCSVASVSMVTLQDFILRLKIRTTLYSIINSTTGKYCSIAFI